MADIASKDCTAEEVFDGVKEHVRSRLIPVARAGQLCTTHVAREVQ